jgi:tetratricopeptide (TPR) repeat protein
MIGGIAATIGFVQASRAKDLAKKEAAIATQVSDFLVDLFEISDPSEARGRTITAMEILDEGATRISTSLAVYEQALAPGSPGIGYCLSMLAIVQLDLDRPEQAQELAQRALAIQEAALGPDHHRLVSTLHCLAQAARTLGQPDRAVVFYRRTLTIAENSPEYQHPDELAKLRSELAEVE